MAAFPRIEAEVVALANAMIAGYTSYPGDFPSADMESLGTAFVNYDTTRNAQIDALVAAHASTEAKKQQKFTMVNLHLVTEQKEEAFKLLMLTMRKELVKSVVDTSGNPEKLKLIGWSVKASLQSAKPLGQCTDLTAVAQMNDSITLKWKAPSTGSGGKWRLFVIERRHKEKKGDFGEWQHASISFETEKILNVQPRGIQLEYRVKAINTEGEGSPSNTASVVL